MASLMDKMLKAGTLKTGTVLSASKFFNQKDPIVTDLPILNVAFSGMLDGGLTSGLTVLAGASKSFKTLLGLYCMKAYLDKYPDGIAILYDSEFGITPEYLESNGIDTDRVLHIPIEHIEQLKFDIVNRLGEISKDDHVFILIDSVGNLASKKEVEDAEKESSAADMTRAKQLKSLFRIITPTLTIKDIPCLAVNHIYMTQEMFSKPVVSGGTGIYYSANTIFIITKSQEKTADGVVGWHYHINIEKSRFVREKVRMSFTVTYKEGINRYSSLFDLALESGHITKASTQGWYNLVDMETGEVLEPKRRAKDLETDKDFLEGLLVDAKFKEFVKEKFQLGGSVMNDAEDQTALDEDLEVEE